MTIRRVPRHVPVGWRRWASRSGPPRPRGSSSRTPLARWSHPRQRPKRPLGPRQSPIRRHRRGETCMAIPCPRVPRPRDHPLPTELSHPPHRLLVRRQVRRHRRRRRPPPRLDAGDGRLIRQIDAGVGVIGDFALGSYPRTVMAVGTSFDFERTHSIIRHVAAPVRRPGHERRKRRGRRRISRSLRPSAPIASSSRSPRSAVRSTSSIQRPVPRSGSSIWGARSST